MYALNNIIPVTWIVQFYWVVPHVSLKLFDISLCSVYDFLLASKDLWYAFPIICTLHYNISCRMLHTQRFCVFACECVCFFVWFWCERMWGWINMKRWKSLSLVSFLFIFIYREYLQVIAWSRSLHSYYDDNKYKYLTVYDILILNS